MNDVQSESPVVKKDKVIGMDFPEAIRKMIAGERVTRISWDDDTSYGQMKDGFLMIFIKGEMHKWIVNDGDMLAEDWIVVKEVN